MTEVRKTRDTVWLIHDAPLSAVRKTRDTVWLVADAVFDPQGVATNAPIVMGKNF